MSSKSSRLEIVGLILVLLMILLQGFYGTYAYIDPAAFSSLRGTKLYSELDADWVIIYGSRTLFIALILSYLLVSRQYSILMWCALFGVVMPITDGWLAYSAQAPSGVVVKHIATIAYLLITFVVLRKVVAQKNLRK